MPPKNLQLTVTWMVLAGLLTLAAFWQAQSAITRDAAARHKSLPPPVKTRHATRPVVPQWSGDVVADYIARCSKGMTDQEIRWIVEDFQNAGLDRFESNDEIPKAELTHYLAAQYQWYYSALVDGLRLNPSQAAECAAKLENSAKISRDRGYSVLLTTGSHLSSSSYSLASALSHGESVAGWYPFMPWKLCGLSHEQEMLTWKNWYDHFSGFFHEPETTAGTEAFASKVASVVLEPSQPKDAPSFLCSNPFFSHLPDRVVLSGWTSSVNWVFPLLSSQEQLYLSKERGPPNASRQEDFRQFLAEFHHLHPEQFRIMLVFNPELSGMIRTALDNSLPDPIAR
jgi:hypothetical protein